MGGQRTIGNYELIGDREVGKGSQGVVWKARRVGAASGDVNTGDIVALKILKAGAGDPTKLVEQLHKLCSLRHPNIVEYREVFIYPETQQCCIAMEFVEGEALDHIIEGSRNVGLPWPKARTIIHKCLDALAYLSAQGVVHRDIKPSNIRLNSRGEVKLIDLETAQRLDATTTTTVIDGFVGTFSYMAPECVTPGFLGDEKADIFSAGVCFVEAVSGSLPFDRFAADKQGIDFMRRWSVRDKWPKPNLDHVRSPVPNIEVKDFLTKLVIPDRAKRYDSFAHALADFRRFLPRVIGEKDGHQYEFDVAADLLGKGGFGAVYRARRLSDGAKVAIKQLHAQKYLARFARERNILSRINHPNIVKFLDFVELENHGQHEYFIVMEFLEGMPDYSLRRRIKKIGGPLPVDESIALFRSYLSAVGYLHESGVIHRDLTPNNLYAPPNRPNDAKVIDLGVAIDESGTMTVSGGLPGVPDYMAPEFATRDNVRGSEQTDLFSLGICFYEALVGRRPFPALPTDQKSQWAAWISRCLNLPQIDYGADAFAKNPELRHIVERMLAPEPEQRYKTAAEITNDLEHGPVPSDAPPPVEDDGGKTTFWDPNNKKQEPPVRPVSPPPPAPEPQIIIGEETPPEGILKPASPVIAEQPKPLAKPPVPPTPAPRPQFPDKPAPPPVAPPPPSPPVAFVGSAEDTIRPGTQKAPDRPPPPAAKRPVTPPPDVERPKVIARAINWKPIVIGAGVAITAVIMVIWWINRPIRYDCEASLESVNGLVATINSNKPSRVAQLKEDAGRKFAEAFADRLDKELKADKRLEASAVLEEWKGATAVLKSNNIAFDANIASSFQGRLADAYKSTFAGVVTASNVVSAQKVLDEWNSVTGRLASVASFNSRIADDMKAQLALMIVKGKESDILRGIQSATNFSALRASLTEYKTYPDKAALRADVESRAIVRISNIVCTLTKNYTEKYPEFDGDKQAVSEFVSQSVLPSGANALFTRAESCISSNLAQAEIDDQIRRRDKKYYDLYTKLKTARGTGLDPLHKEVVNGKWTGDQIKELNTMLDKGVSDTIVALIPRGEEGDIQKLMLAKTALQSLPVWMQNCDPFTNALISLTSRIASGEVSNILYGVQSAANFNSLRASLSEYKTYRDKAGPRAEIESQAVVRISNLVYTLTKSCTTSYTEFGADKQSVGEFVSQKILPPGASTPFVDAEIRIHALLKDQKYNDLLARLKGAKSNELDLLHKEVVEGSWSPEQKTALGQLLDKAVSTTIADLTPTETEQKDIQKLKLAQTRMLSLPDWMQKMDTCVNAKSTLAEQIRVLQKGMETAMQITSLNAKIHRLNPINASPQTYADFAASVNSVVNDATSLALYSAVATNVSSVTNEAELILGSALSKVVKTWDSPDRPAVLSNWVVSARDAMKMAGLPAWATRTLAASMEQVRSELSKEEIVVANDSKYVVELRWPAELRRQIDRIGPGGSTNFLVTSDVGVNIQIVVDSSAPYAARRKRIVETAAPGRRHKITLADAGFPVLPTTVTWSGARKDAANVSLAVDGTQFVSGQNMPLAPDASIKLIWKRPDHLDIPATHKIPAAESEDLAQFQPPDKAWIPSDDFSAATNFIALVNGSNMDGAANFEQKCRNAQIQDKGVSDSLKRSLIAFDNARAAAEKKMKEATARMVNRLRAACYLYDANPDPDESPIKSAQGLLKSMRPKVSASLKDSKDRRAGVWWTIAVNELSPGAVAKAQMEVEALGDYPDEKAMDLTVLEYLSKGIEDAEKGGKHPEFARFAFHIRLRGFLADFEVKGKTGMEPDRVNELAELALRILNPSAKFDIEKEDLVALTMFAEKARVAAEASNWNETVALLKKLDDALAKARKASEDVSK